MKRSVLFLSVLLLLVMALLCACGGNQTENPNGPNNNQNQPPSDEYDSEYLEIADTIQSYKVVYPEGNDTLETVAKRIARTLSDGGIKGIPTISDAELTDADVYLITVGDVETGTEYGEAFDRAIRRETNSLYGGFVISFEGKHIYILGDDDDSLTAGAEYFRGTYLEKGEDTYMTIPGPDYTEMMYFSKEDYRIYDVYESMVDRKDLMKITEVLSIVPKAGEDYLRVDQTRDGITLVLNEGDEIPALVCETASPFASCKVGLFNPVNNKLTITVTAGDKKTKEDIQIGIKFIDQDYLFTISEEAVDAALAVKPTVFVLGKGNYTNTELHGANALLTLALYENAYPEKKAGVANTIVQHLRSTTASGAEPQMQVGPWWAHPNYACAVAIARQTPSVWNKLNDGEVERLDWIMRCYAIINNYASNTKNNFLTGPEMAGNFNKGWNPNFQSSNLIPILACVSYFGSADAVNDILVNFSYDEYIAKLTKLGFTNIVTNWTKADKQNGAGFAKRLMEQGMGTASNNFTYKDSAGETQGGGYGVGVKIPFTYTFNGKEIPLSDVAGIFNCAVQRLYSETVVNYVGQAYIKDRVPTPYLGKFGMMREYNTSDNGGVRSDAAYCTHNFGMMMPSMAALITLGLYDVKDPVNKAFFPQIYVGNEDHIFRLTQGYKSYSKGGFSSGSGYHTEANIGYVYTNAKSIWRDYLIKFVTENP